jgi:predicted deacylase
MILNSIEILPGEEKQVNANIAKLPTRTSIDIPIIVSRSKEEGPTLLLMAGMHGDEINGVEIVRRMISNNYHRPDIGTTICIPIVNIYGFLNFSRQLPGGKDLNRSFPGTINGSLASQIAYHIRTSILPLIDFGLDFHTGGSRINNFPQIRGKMDDATNLDIAKSFGAKYIVNSPFREKSLRKEAGKLGKPILVYEGGESLRLRKQAIDHGVNGALRVMKYLGMRKEAPKQTSKSIQLSTSKWIRASASGLYHSYVRTGDIIQKGQDIGLIAGPYGDYQKKIRSSMSGHVIAINNTPIINKGDALMHIGIVDN